MRRGRGGAWRAPAGRRRGLPAIGGLALLLQVALGGAAAPAEAQALEAMPLQIVGTESESALAALSRIAREEAAELWQGSHGGALLVRASLDSPVEARGAASLLDAIVAPIVTQQRDAGRFEIVHLARVPPGGSDRELAGARGFRALLELDLRLEGAQLVLDLSASESPQEGLAALFACQLRPLHQLRIRALLDAQLRALVAPEPRLSEETLIARSVPLPVRGYLAAAAHDLDGDGSAELVLLDAERLYVFGATRRSGRGWRLEPRAELPLPPAPEGTLWPRRLIASLLAAGDALLVQAPARPQTFALRAEAGRWTLSPLESGCPPGSHALPDACARLAPGRDYFESRLQGRAGLPAPPRAPSSFYQRRSARIRQVDGTLVRVEAILTPRGRLAVEVGERRVSVSGHGAALAMADVDADGDAELLLSDDVLPGEGDRLTLARIRSGDGAVLHVWSSDALAGSVFVAASGDLDGDGLPELLAVEEPATGSTAESARLWVVR